MEHINLDTVERERERGISSKTRNWQKNIFIIIFFLALIAISIIIRIPKEKEFYNNIDATQHVLLTMKCYDETPISVHKFLPIISLGDKEDKNISWGSCIPDKNGNYYYTSFSPAGFVFPYMFIKALKLPINIYSLYAFNSIIYIATFILTSIIFCKLFSKYINKSLIVIFTALIYLFQMEILHSQGCIYWVHSIMQLFIAIQFLLFLNYKNNKAKFAFFIMCFIMPYKEWTGYISNIAFAIIIFIQNIIENKRLTVKCFLEPVIIGFLTVLSLIAFSIHFLLNVKFSDYIKTLKSRFLSRNITVSDVQITDLLKGYVISYKYLIALCIALLLITISVKEYRIKLWKLIKEYKYVLIYFTLILLENIIMLQHAIQYTFDRLKGIYILITLFFILLSTIYISLEKNKKAITNLIMLILSIIVVINIVNYKGGYGEYITEKDWEKQNQIIADYINNNFNKSNSIIGNGKPVRGYLNMLFNRGIFEIITYDQAQLIAQIYNKQYAIYFNARDLYKIDEIIIKDIINNIEEIVYVEKDKIVIKPYQ